MEWPKRARTADWESGVLTLDKEKQLEVPELTMELMELLARYTPVSYTHLRAHENEAGLVCRPVLDKRKMTMYAWMLQL